MGKYDIAPGQVFGYLTVICEEERRILKNGVKSRMVRVRCVCGKEFIMFVVNLVRRTISCGCKSARGAWLKTHGLSSHPLYTVWGKMIDRVKNDPTSKNYKNYYGKGVRVCKEWIDDFMNFYNWAIDKWEAGLQLDKDIIPFKLGIPALLYSPEMCCFVTSMVNNNTKSDSDYVEYEGEKITVTQLARKFGMSKSTLHRRVHQMSMPIEQAVLQINLVHTKNPKNIKSARI